VLFFISDEDRLEAYTCNVSDCNFTDMNAAINTNDNIISFTNNELGFFMIAEVMTEITFTDLISSLTPDKSNVAVNENINITLNVTSDYSIDEVVFNVGDDSVSPALQSNSGNNYDYRYNYTFTTIGNNIVNVTITDNLLQRDIALLNISVDNKESIEVDSINYDLISVKDKLTNRTIVSNTSKINSNITKGFYNVELKKDKKKFLVKNVNLSGGQVVVLNVTNKTGINIPANITSKEMFSVKNKTKFREIVFEYNYSSYLPGIIDEDNLEVYKCSNESNCTWVELNINIDKSRNMITFSLNNLSVFSVVESVLVNTETIIETITETVTVETSGTSSGGGSIPYYIDVPRVVSMSIVAPKSYVLEDNEVLDIPIIVKNTGQLNLSDIVVEIESDNIETTPIGFDINNLGVNSTSKSNIKVFSEDQNFNDSVVYIKAFEPNYNISAFASIVIKKDYDNITDSRLIKEKLIFVSDLFKENSECLELQEILNQAQDAIDAGEESKGLLLLDNALGACRDLIHLKERNIELEKARSTIKLDKKIDYQKLFIYFIIVIFGFVFILSFISVIQTFRQKKGYVKKKKKSKKKFFKKKK
ncbi:MAG: hypothetical protein ACOC1K_03005, partial [Nanoarchaeota archaeon]